MSTSRPIFRVSSDADLPPLPGGPAPGAIHPLERLLEDLLETAGANVIPSPAQAPDGPDIVDAFGALKAASAQYDVAPGIGLADHFWTHGAPYHSGAVGAQLARTAGAGRSVQGFLALYATEIRSPLLYSEKQSPLRVSGTIGTLPDVSGPYVTLVTCEGSADGSAEAVVGFAMPVFTARRFLPVRSELDRDVLRALEHLQVSLDAHGIECTVQRIRPRTPSTVTTFNVSVCAAGGIPRYFRLAVDPAGTTSQGGDGDRSFDFTVTHRN